MQCSHCKLTPIELDSDMAASLSKVLKGAYTISASVMVKTSTPFLCAKEDASKKRAIFQRFSAPLST